MEKKKRGGEKEWGRGGREGSLKIILSNNDNEAKQQVVEHNDNIKQ